jgi:hypothetical protein
MALMLALSSCAFADVGIADASGSKVPRASAASGCEFVPVVRPARFVLACATGNDNLVDVHWIQWGNSVAVANAENSYNTCKPDCASSRTWITTEAEVRLGFVVPTTSGPIFRTLSWRDVTSQTCSLSQCVTRWQAWQSEPLMVSASYYVTGAACPAADMGLAADGLYGSLVWCEAIGSRHQWVHIS